MPSTLPVLAGALVLPLAIAAILAQTHNPRWDLSGATVGAKIGLAALVGVVVLPVVGPLLNVRYLHWLVFLLGLGYALCQYVLVVATAITGYVTASGVRSWTEAFVFGTPAVAGIVWWVGLLFVADVPPVPTPLSAFDLATLPTFVGALAYAGVRSIRQ